MLTIRAEHQSYPRAASTLRPPLKWAIILLCKLTCCLCNVQGSANVELYEGLLMLQHRGQDSAGMVTTDGVRFHEHKANGLVKDVFTNELAMKKLTGSCAHTGTSAGWVVL